MGASMLVTVTDHLVVHLLAQHKVKLFRVTANLFVFRFEGDQHPVLHEVVELDGGRVKSLSIKVMHPRIRKKKR